MNDETLEKIYRYQPFKTLSLDALCQDQLYFSDPNKFNDPLGCTTLIVNDIDWQNNNS